MTGQVRVTLTNGEVLVGHPTGFPTLGSDGQRVEHLYVYGAGDRDIPGDLIREVTSADEPIGGSN